MMKLFVHQVQFRMLVKLLVYTLAVKENRFCDATTQNKDCKGQRLFHNIYDLLMEKKVMYAVCDEKRNCC